MASAAVPADLLVLVGDAGLEPGIAYAVRQVSAQLERASGERVDLPRLLLADDVASISAVFARPFWIGDGRSLGTLQLLQTQLMDLAIGDAIVIEQEIWVGSRADVASATERMQAAEPLVRGRVDDARASLSVEDARGAPATQVRPDPDGRFEMRLPRGSYCAASRRRGRPRGDARVPRRGGRGRSRPHRGRSARAGAPPARRADAPDLRRRERDAGSELRRRPARLHGRGPRAAAHGGRAKPLARRQRRRSRVGGAASRPLPRARHARARVLRDRGAPRAAAGQRRPRSGSSRRAACSRHPAGSRRTSTCTRRRAPTARSRCRRGSPPLPPRAPRCWWPPTTTWSPTTRR